MKNLYVGNLPHSTTEADLRSALEPYGAVEKITLVTDRDTGRSRGFGFVEMTNAGEAEQAIAALNGKDFGGRPLTINEAKPKTERPRGGAPFRGGGGGGRGGGGGEAGVVADAGVAAVVGAADAIVTVDGPASAANRGGSSRTRSFG